MLYIRSHVFKSYLRMTLFENECHLAIEFYWGIFPLQISRQNIQQTLFGKLFYLRKSCSELVCYLTQLK